MEALNRLVRISFQFCSCNTLLAFNMLRLSQSNQNDDLIQQAKLLEFANSNRNAGSFNDVTILTGGESIPANRMVLACYSKFFKSMFRSQLKEKYQNTVEIKEFDGHAIRIIIQFIYARKIDITTKNVMALLRAADFLQVDEVKKMCFDCLESSLTLDSCFEVVKLLIYITVFHHFEKPPHLLATTLIRFLKKTS